MNPVKNHENINHINIIHLQTSYENLKNQIEFMTNNCLLYELSLDLHAFSAKPTFVYFCIS
jgi:hypothetical protein